MASTWKSMEIMLTPERLTVTPAPLALWLTRLLALDLHHDIPVDAITSVRETGKEAGLDSIELTYRLPDGRERELQLFLKQGRAFIEALSPFLVKQP